MLSQLISIMSLASWVQAPLWSLMLTLDGIVYSLVSYSYKLFMLMSQINYNVLYSILSPLIDRVKALIMVLILFKVVVAFLQFLVEPEKFDDKTKGGKQLVVNVLIVAGVLGISGFVFGLFNDLSMLVLGTFGGPEAFQVIKVDSGDTTINNGLLSRLIFGKNKQMDTADSFGKYLAASTLNIFLYDTKESKTKEAASIYNKIINSKENTTGSTTATTGASSDDFDMMQITELADDIGRTVKYRYPLLSTIMGLYLIYSIVKIAVEVGVRMFKLIVLQIIAPIPIISIVSDGVNGQTFKKFTNLFMGTFTSIFIRVGSLYLVTGFISEFYQQLSGQSNNGSLFGNSAAMASISDFTKGMLLMILTVAAFTFVNALPKFLSEIFGTNFGEADKGFGKFLGAVGGGIIGGASGAISGIASGAGFPGTLVNMAAGTGRGVYGGFKGTKISDTISKNRNMAQGIANAGGVTGYGLENLNRATGIQSIQEQRAQKFTRRDQAAENMVTSRQNAIAKLSNTAGRKYGTSKEAYAAQEVKYDADYVKALRQYEDAKKGNKGTFTTAEDAMLDAQVKMDDRVEKKETDYNTALFANSEVQKDASVVAADRNYDIAKGEKDLSAKQLKAAPEGAVKAIKDQRKKYAAKTEKIEQGSVMQRAGRNSGGKGK